ncbi:steryl-sulfatase-like isoform X1 [Patella vulgata]|uniref:steryl-sulfatase-like isoform X1 n=2 Tax=Patella vulgata TaxID=6465 RepID=UPI0024A7F65E|nr:steryl-sulfatase-like isoform X1 [Patella vulgata]XP_055956789.1 steryl-sulfatase-like isoform X1 [Patella vulgata]
MAISCFSQPILFVLLSISITSSGAKKPNIILIMADDLGIGDVGCFGNTTIKTPNIDRLAREGAKLTHHLSASSLCGPSRAAFLTGRYPIRSGMAPRGFPPVFIFVASSGGLPTSETTFAELAKAAGYTTALMGKWHQGWSESSFGDYEHHPNNQGFDYFYGFPLTNLKDFGSDTRESLMKSVFPYWNHQLITTFLVLFICFTCLYSTRMIGLALYIVLVIFVSSVLFTLHYAYIIRYKNFNSLLYRNKELVEQPMELSTLTKRFAAEGVEFLENRQKDDKPFLLMVSWSQVHTYLNTTKEFRGRNKHGRYGDAVEEMDWGVGEILDTLDRLNLVDNTLVYFTSDNGGHLEERNADGEVHGGYNGIYKGGKAHGAVDGGIRVPTVLRYPPAVRPGTVIDEPTSLMDIFPTIANIIQTKLQQKLHIDGYDMIPLLSGKETVSPHDFMFHYCGDDIHAIRYRPKHGMEVWKLAIRSPNYLPGKQVCRFFCNCRNAVVNNPPLLYDMTSDPSELRPLDLSRYPEIVNIMLKAMDDHKNSIIPQPCQMDLSRILWKPWLQPCCGSFPSCSCIDKKYEGQFE